LSRIIRFCLEQKLIVFLVMLLFIGWGMIVAPFDWDIKGLMRSPVPVDAIPDIGENQQIVFTEWMGRSPQDVQDQITYPLTVALLGVPGVKTIRSFSMFGFSSIYVIFSENVDFYWSRSRLLEKLNSLPPGMLPQGVQPTLGPDATALGQVFWYTLEGRDPQGNPTGGWDLEELRSIQDWYVRYALLSAEGVSEVASVGGFVKEYQIDADPDAMRAAGVTLGNLFEAVKMSNIDVGARTIEINRVEYVIRGIGFIKSLRDIEESVIKVNQNLPIRVKDVARVSMGPSLRRGVLDKGGAEAVGGAVVVRYGANPLQAIKNVKEKIREISPGLASKTLPDGTVSRVNIVPFYDRTGLIKETLGTLNTALMEEIMVTVIVVIFSVMHLRSSILISGLLPLAVLMCFIAMKMFRVDANIVALSGIAIAIGTMVDMGIVICENILKRLDEAPPGSNRLEVVYRAAVEVGSAVLTAVSTTVVGFLPVFAMEGPEGKLFKPLAYTKTFCLIASIIVALTIIPPFAHLLFTKRNDSQTGSLTKKILPAGLIVAGALVWMFIRWWLGFVLLYLALIRILESLLPGSAKGYLKWFETAVILALFTFLLATHWLPLGPEKGDTRNVLFVAVLIGAFLFAYEIFKKLYPYVLRWCLDHKALFLFLPFAVSLLGLVIWLGAHRLTAWLPKPLRSTAAVVGLNHAFPGLGKEFMPPLDEGSYLYMPTTMPHASIGEVQDILGKQDMAFSAIPEVETAVGKLGRAESPLDPAPISMIETVINYKPEYLLDRDGTRRLFKFRADKLDYFRAEDGSEVLAPDGKPYLVQGKFLRDEQGALIPHRDGKPFRLWRPPLDPKLNEGRQAWSGIRAPDDIWDQIVIAADMPGVTSAPRLQPIAARIVMLQSGMRAPMGIKVKGPDLQTIERVGFQLERLLKEVPYVEPSAVIADRIVGKPYIEIVINRDAIARYGIMLSSVQEVIEVAIGGKAVTTTVEGRERYAVRVRYLRELRDTLEGLEKILVSSPKGEQVPLTQLAAIRYVRGPQMIKSEDTFLTGYVLFDKKPGYAEVDVVEQAKTYLDDKIQKGEFTLPPGVSVTFAGTYENQLRAQKKLSLVLPLALFVIMIILYLQFRALPTTFMVFSGIFVAGSGGFILIWLYGQSWFLNFHLFGTSVRELFQVHPINLSVAVWVGFLALFGIATDDGVLMATYLKQSLEAADLRTTHDLRSAVVAGALRRLRPCIMTVSTTVLALLPVLTSTGKGADIMVPMAIPSFGGMLIVLLTVFVVPVLYSAREEHRFRRRLSP
jgi:Cu(I)/Ag(I) efflux system membrane protein CusA/SilA